MMPHDPSKSDYPKLPVPYSNGHNPPPASALSGGAYLETDPAMLPGAAAEGSDLSIFRAVRRCWLPALCLGLLGAAGAAAAMWFLWPSRYTAQALVHIPPRPGTYGEDLQQHARTRAAQLKSRSVIAGALRQQEVLGLSMVREEADPVIALEKNLLVDSNLGPEILRVSLSGNQPEELPIIVNALVAVFAEEVGQKDQSAYRTKLKQLQDRKLEYEALLRDKRRTLQGLEERHGPEVLQTTAQRRELTLQQLAALEKDLVQTQVDLKVTLKELETLNSKGPDAAAAAVSEAAVEEYLRQDPRYQQLQTELLKAEQDAARVEQIATAQGQSTVLAGIAGRRAALQKAVEDRRRDVRPLVERLARSRAQTSAREAQAKLEARRAGLEERDRQLVIQVERLKKALREPVGRLPEVDAVRDGIVSLEAGLKRVNEQLDALQIEAPVAAQVHVLEQATPPRSKNTDRQMKMAGVAGLGAFGLLFAGLVWREVRTRRVYAVNDVVSRVGANLLGTLPGLPARVRRSLPTAAPERDSYWRERLGESVDAIRTQLLRAAQLEGLKVVMVTSAVGGEGKTSLAMHLAASLARAWRKTLLIDGDLRKPAVHRQFEQELEPGFCDVLRGEFEFSEVIRPTPISRLWIVPAGQWDPHALQALAQDTVQKLFEPLKEQYDFIIIDSSPVLPVADTLSLGQHVDGAIFAVLRDVSRLPAIQAAHQRLAALDIRLLGSVLIGANEELVTLGYSPGVRPRVTSATRVSE